MRIGLAYPSYSDTSRRAMQKLGGVPVDEHARRAWRRDPVREVVVALARDEGKSSGAARS
jgi:hypothetical protein